MNLDDSILPSLGKTMKLLDLYIEDQFHEAGIPLTKLQFVFLMVISRNNGQPQNLLAELTGRDKTTFTRNLNTLERKDLVERIPAEHDKRIKLIYIKPLGKKYIEDCRPIIGEVVEKIESDLSQQEKDIFSNTLSKIQDKLMTLTGNPTTFINTK